MMVRDIAILFVGVFLVCAIMLIVIGVALWRHNRRMRDYTERFNEYVERCERKRLENK